MSFLQHSPYDHYNFAICCLHLGFRIVKSMLICNFRVREMNVFANSCTKQMLKMTTIRRQNRKFNRLAPSHILFTDNKIVINSFMTVKLIENDKWEAEATFIEWPRNLRYKNGVIRRYESVRRGRQNAALRNIYLVIHSNDISFHMVKYPEAQCYTH